MEKRTGTSIEKWDDVNGVVHAEFGMKLPQELDPNTLGNVRRGLEDQIEQNDNNFDGVINNVTPENHADKVRDDNCNGVPDEEENRIVHMDDVEKGKISILKQLHEAKHDNEREREVRQIVPALGL